MKVRVCSDCGEPAEHIGGGVMGCVRHGDPSDGVPDLVEVDVVRLDAEPTTSVEALAQAKAWGHTQSHLNEMMAVEHYDRRAQPDRQRTLVRTAEADAAEAARLSSIAVALAHIEALGKARVLVPSSAYRTPEEAALDIDEVRRGG